LTVGDQWGEQLLALEVAPGQFSVGGVTDREQGSGILRSMSEANCFIILPTDQGNVTSGTMVEVQVMEGVI